LEKTRKERNDKDRRNLVEFMLTQAVLGNKNGFHECLVGERKASQKVVSLISKRKMKQTVFLQRLNYPLTIIFSNKKRKKGCSNWEITKILYKQPLM